MKLDNPMNNDPQGAGNAPAQPRKAHWGEATFHVVMTTPAYDDSETVNRYGYCTVCKGDMQSFGNNGLHGPVKHYASHSYAKRAGVWGKQAR